MPPNTNTLLKDVSPIRKPELKSVPPATAKPMLKDVPPIVHGKHNGRQVAFERGRFLGKGGFARCYELIDKTRNITYAGKVISKTILIKKSQRDKVMQEVMIHSSLKHPHIVRLDGHFEDADNVFVLLELCARRSLMEFHKRRRVVTEPEARYFTHQQTYSKIRKNEYVIPTRIGQHAHEMIAALLAPQPEDRPTVFDIPKFKFFSRGFLPEALPVSCLVSVPRFNQENLSGGMIEPETHLGDLARPTKTCEQPYVVQYAASMIVNSRKPNENDEIPIIEHLNNMANQLSPFFYRQGEHYIEATGAESFYTATQYAHTLNDKITMLKDFRSCMLQHLLSADEKLPRRGQEFARFPCLSAWFRTNSAIVLMMTDGTLQLNFFADHTMIIVCPSMQAVTFIDPNRVPHTYRLQHLVESGCSHELRKRLKYAKTMVDRMLSRGNNAALCQSNTES
ncbi:Serine/threonine-protein kinase PLK [Aphelenchoides fujianensis]|nr:Serine/threonine-protein kinase PLK [Aphelenchoides fujianensis]